MIVTTVTIQVKKEHIDEFIAATRENHRHSVREPGNMRFDVLQYKDDPCLFTLYEAYESEQTVQAHKETLHYKKWKETVEPYMASPRKGIAHRVIAPERSGW